MALDNLLMMLALVRSPMRDMLSARPSISHSLLPEGGLPAGCRRKPCRTVMPRPSKVWTSKPACVRSLEGRPRTHSLLMVERASLPLSAEPMHLHRRPWPLLPRPENRAWRLENGEKGEMRAVPVCEPCCPFSCDPLKGVGSQLKGLKGVGSHGSTPTTEPRI